MKPGPVLAAAVAAAVVFSAAPAQARREAAAAGKTDFARLVASDTFWRLDPAGFMASHGNGRFVFADASKNVANALGRGAVAWNGLDVWETRVYFPKAGTVSRVEFSLYNKGDDPEAAGLGAEKLEELVSKAAAGLDGVAQARRRTVRAKLKTGGYKSSFTVASGNAEYEFVWASDSLKTKDLRADYLRLAVKPAAKRSAKPARPAGGAARFRANVRKSPDGDVAINGVPMVDQGQKGYCAAAVAERMLRYYGLEMDEHELAQMAGTTAKGGTSSDSILAALEALSAKGRFAVREIVSFNDSMRTIEKDVAAYNKAAKAKRRPQIDLSECYEGRTLMVGEIRDRMEPDVLLAVRSKDARRGRFMNEVRRRTSEGLPVVWAVTLGLYPEQGLQQERGGHFRLIIGYNDKTGEILYTDTWGAGHELKRMRADHAFAMTQSAYFLQPL